MKKLILLFTAVVSSLTTFAQAPRRVVLEDFTGSGCGYCPRGRTVMEDIQATYPNVIGLGLHNYNSSDPVYNAYVGALNVLNTYGAPGGSVDRFKFSSESALCFGTDKWKANVASRMSVTAPVAVSFTSTYNSSTRLVSIIVTANFVGTASGDIRMNCILTEDGIQANNIQHNYMNTTSGDPWNGKGDPITNYVYNDVVMANLSTDTWGASGIIPASVSVGSTYSNTYTFTIPPQTTTPVIKWDASKMNIVAFISKYGTSAVTNREILNATKGPLGSNTTGVFENPNIDQVQIKQNSPNPFSEVTAIQFQLNTTDNVSVKVYNAFGQLVNTIMNTKLIAGEHTFYWAGTDNEGKAVAGGMYYYTISTSSHQVTKPMIFVGR